MNYFRIVLLLLASIVIPANAVPRANTVAAVQTAAADTQPDPARGPVYAVVNGMPIYSAEIVALINSLAPEQFRQLSGQVNGIQRFIDDYLTTRLVTERARGLGLESTDTFIRKLRGASDGILYQSYIQTLVNGVPQPTDQELDIYYRLHLAQYVQPASVLLMYSMVRDSATADHIYREARLGADFSILMARTSISSDSMITLTASNIAPEISAALIALPAGDYFPPYATDAGIYIFKKIATFPQRIIPLGEIRDRVRQTLHREKVAAFVATYLETLKRDYPIEVIGTLQ